MHLLRPSLPVPSSVSPHQNQRPAALPLTSSTPQPQASNSPDARNHPQTDLGRGSSALNQQPLFKPISYSVHVSLLIVFHRLLLAYQIEILPHSRLAHAAALPKVTHSPSIAFQRYQSTKRKIRPSWRHGANQSPECFGGTIPLE